MRHFDLTPLYRSTIGFDRLGSLLDTLTSLEGEAPSYPPYNIERVGENEYRISMAVAGFGEGDLSIDVKENTLSIRGEKRTEQEDTTFLHRGIASRSFERRFQLADDGLIAHYREVFDRGVALVQPPDPWCAFLVDRLTDRAWKEMRETGVSVIRTTIFPVGNVEDPWGDYQKSMDEHRKLFLAALRDTGHSADASIEIPRFARSRAAFSMQRA